MPNDCCYAAIAKIRPMSSLLSRFLGLAISVSIASFLECSIIWSVSLTTTHCTAVGCGVVLLRVVPGRECDGRSTLKQSSFALALVHHCCGERSQFRIQRANQAINRVKGAGCRGEGSRMSIRMGQA